MTKYNMIFFEGYDGIIKMKLTNKEHLTLYSEDGIKLIHSTEYITRRIKGVENCLEYLKENLTEKEYLEFERATYDKI